MNHRRDVSLSQQTADRGCLVSFAGTRSVIIHSGTVPDLPFLVWDFETVVVVPNPAEKSYYRYQKIPFVLHRPFRTVEAAKRPSSA